MTHLARTAGPAVAGTTSARRIEIVSIASVLGQCSAVSDDTDMVALPCLHVENWAS